MKIAFIVEKFPTLSQTFIFNQITGLLDRGHELDIYAIGGPSRDIPGIEEDEEYRPLLRRTYYYPLRVPARLFLPFYKMLWWFSPDGAKDISKWLRSFDVSLGGRKSYDIIHCQFGTSALKTMEYVNRGFLKGKLIATFRGGDISMFLQKRGDKVYDALFKTGDLFLTNCEYFKERLIRLGCDAGKLFVHESSIDCRRFFYKNRQFPSDGYLRIVTTARLVPKKGIHDSIRAVAQVLKCYPNLEYIVIGEGVLRKSLEDLIDQLGVSGKVRLVGQKRSEEIIQFLEGAHLFVAASVTTDEGNEDAPVNTLKEAMAMGLPVVATRHGGIPELVEDGVSGFLVPERDPDAIAEKLEHLIRNPQLWPEMGRQGRAKVEEKYDKDKLNAELVEIYQRLRN